MRTTFDAGGATARKRNAQATESWTLSYDPSPSDGRPLSMVDHLGRQNCHYHCNPNDINVELRCALGCPDPLTEASMLVLLCAVR
jgi:hypothetical protein